MAVNKPYYEVVRDILAANIENGRLAPGTRLLTAAVADRLGVSRPPVKRALQLLEEERRIRPSASQGYVVGGGAQSEPQRINLHLIDLDLPSDISGNLVQASWERIFETVEEDTLNCIPFGTYQLSEAALGEHFSVSRTVVRDVLSRLHGRGIIVKDRASHWIAGPMSARMLDEAHEIRRLLEPGALASALPYLDRALLRSARERLRLALEGGRPVSQEEVDGFEADLHATCIEAARNRRLAETVRLSQISLVINRLFGTYIGVHDETEMLSEHRLVFDHLILSNREGAEAAMRFHLEADHARARARLKVLSVFGEPAVAPYLSRIH